MSTNITATVTHENVRIEIVATGNGEYQWDAFIGGRHIVGGVTAGTKDLDGVREDIATRVRNPFIKQACKSGSVSIA